MEKIVKKAYKINLNKIDEGYLYSDKVVFAETINDAKQLLLAETKYDDMKLLDGREFTYMTIPVIRAKEYDKILCDGEWLDREQIKVRDFKRQIQQELSDPAIKFCYIRKGGYYYRPNSRGYTEYVRYAGVYTKEEALKDVMSCSGEVTAIPIDIEEHNKMLNECIEDFKTRIIR